MAVLIEEEILNDPGSRLEPGLRSGCNSDDEDDGGRVLMEEPTGMDTTGILTREEADGL